MKETANKTLNLLMLIATAVVSGVMWLPVNLLYRLLIDSVSRPVAVGVAFALMLIAVSFVCWLLSTLTMSFKGDVITGEKSSAKIPLYIVGLSLVCALLGCGLELLYEIEIKQDYNAPEGYIFVVDDSASTASTDPNGQRYEAIQSLLETKADTYPYMVYSFATNIVVEQGMSVVGDGIPDLSGRYEGGTNIRAALQTVINDYNNGGWTAETVPTVILITDGMAGDIGLFRPVNRVLSEYIKAGVAISTVGFDGADRNLLKNIATKTGGVFVDIADADALDEVRQPPRREAQTQGLQAQKL